MSMFFPVPADIPAATRLPHYCPESHERIAPIWRGSWSSLVEERRPFNNLNRESAVSIGPPISKSMSSANVAENLTPNSINSTPTGTDRPTFAS